MFFRPKDKRKLRERTREKKAQLIFVVFIYQAFLSSYSSVLHVMSVSMAEHFNRAQEKSININVLSAIFQCSGFCVFRFHKNEVSLNMCLCLYACTHIFARFVFFSSQAVALLLFNHVL